MGDIRKNKTAIFTGIASIVAIPVWLFLIAPSLLQLPEDYFFTANVVTSDNFYDNESEEFEGEIYSKTNYVYKTISVENNQAVVWGLSNTRTLDNEPITSIERYYSIDRLTNSHLSGLGDRDRDGYLFAPRNLDKNQSFIFWNLQYDIPETMNYVDTENIDGLNVYHYRSESNTAKTDQRVELELEEEEVLVLGIEIETNTELWIEPVTGSLIKYKDYTNSYTYDLETEERISAWSISTNTFDEDSIAKIVHDARFEKTKHMTVLFYIPILLLLIGLLSLIKAFGITKRLPNVFSSRNLAMFSGIISIGVACVVISGWALQNYPLVQFFQFGNGMNPVFAICFIMLGVATILNKNQKITLGIGIVLTLIGLLKIFSLLEIIEPNIDMLMFGNAIMNASFIATMSFYSSVSFLLLGIALITGTKKEFSNLHLTEIMTTIAIILSLFSIIINLFDISNFAYISILFSAPLHETLLILVSGFALYFIFKISDEYALVFSGWTTATGILFLSLFATVVLAGFVQQSYTGLANSEFKNAISNSVINIENGFELKDIEVNIYEGTEKTDSALISGDFTGDRTSNHFENSFVTTKTLYTDDRPLTVEYIGSENFSSSLLSRIAPMIAMIFGICVSILITLVFYALASSRQKAIAFADQAVKDLSQDKAETEAMLASIGDGLIALDKDGRVLTANKAFEEIIGWKIYEVRGKKLSKIIPMLDKDGKVIPERNRLHTKTMKKNVKGLTSSSTSFYYKKKDGVIFPVALTISPIILGGEVIGAVEVFRDITKETEVGKAKTELVSLASHQLRTPLSTINWYTEMLLSGDAGKLRKEQKEFLEEIYGGTQKMTELVNALLNVSRLELGTFIVEPKPTNIVLLSKAVIKEQSPQIKNKKIKVKEIYPKEVGEINVDPKLITIILQNLTSNAIKYTPESGTVEVEIQINKKDFYIRVADSGWGIPESEKDKIFSKLYRATNVKAHDVEGTGLGLYIIKSIVEHAKGSISFDSVENQGTTFHVTLPITGMIKKDGENSLS